MLLTKKDQPDFHNGAILIISGIIKHVIYSASEQKIGALYYGYKSTTPLQTTLEEFGYSQEGPKTFTANNSTAHGLNLDTMVPKASKSNDMRF